MLIQGYNDVYDATSAANSHPVDKVKAWKVCLEVLDFSFDVNSLLKEVLEVTYPKYISCFEKLLRDDNTFTGKVPFLKASFLLRL